MYLVDEELARGYLKHQARILKEQISGLQWQQFYVQHARMRENGKALGILGRKGPTGSGGTASYTMGGYEHSK